MNRKLRFRIMFILFLAISACGRADTNIDTPFPESPGSAIDAASTGYYFTINEIVLDHNGYVALTNFTDVPASLAGLSLCQGSDCFDLPDVVVGPGETARIAVGGGSGYENVIATGATIGELRPLDGEIALLSTETLEESQVMFFYFQWGSTPHDRTKAAVDAGLWIEGGYGPSGENATRLFRDQDSGLWLWE